jgi:hypothetical protein
LLLPQQRHRHLRQWHRRRERRAVLRSIQCGSLVPPPYQHKQRCRLGCRPRTPAVGVQPDRQLQAYVLTRKGHRRVRPGPLNDNREHHCTLQDSCADGGGLLHAHSLCSGRTDAANCDSGFRRIYHLNHKFDHDCYYDAGLNRLHESVLGQLVRGPSELHYIRDNQSNPLPLRQPLD